MRALSGRRVAVIGGTGFIGSHLTERLVKEGADVLAVARSASRLSHLAAVRGDCLVAVADMLDGDATIRILRRFKPEVVFHLAAHPDGTESFAHIAECVRVNGLGLVHTLQAAVAAGADLFVYGGSAKDYGNADVPFRAAQRPTPVCSYAIVKSAGWDLCQLVSRFSTMRTVALRPSFVYGPRQNRNVITYVFECAATGRPVRLMGGNQTRDPIYIDDAVSAFVAAATASAAWGHAIPIGGGAEITVQAICEAALQAVGSTVPIVTGAEEPRLTEVWRSTSDISDAERLLGWRPLVSIAHGLARTAAASTTRIHKSALLEVPIRPRPDAYLSAMPGGLIYRMLDRREGGDRRQTFRGGRRAEDRRAVAAVSRLGARPTAHALPFRSFSAVGGDSL
jgi:UDP-glucose 4-epimerase